jgi:hypothetical protein
MRLPFKRKRQQSFATSSSQEEKVAPVLLRNWSFSQQTNLSPFRCQNAVSFSHGERNLASPAICYDFGTHSKVLRSTVQENQIFGKEPSLPPIKAAAVKRLAPKPHERKK